MTTTETTEAIRRVLEDGRNGINRAIRYSPLFPRFLISDGAQALADAAGCYWLLDVLATELGPSLLLAINKGEVATVQIRLVREEGSRGARVEAIHGGHGAAIFWSKEFPYVSFPAGDWMLFRVGALEWDAAEACARNVIAILPSEH